MIRGFEILPEYVQRGVVLPSRQTAASAGYDLAAAEDAMIPPGAVVMVPTGLRAVMPGDEYLAIHVRSSVALRRGLVLANGTGIIDADYAHNPQNGGHILIALRNSGSTPAAVARGERIAQGIFQRYLIVDHDVAQGVRHGGFGSTGQA